jgi:hypothetical protein
MSLRDSIDFWSDVLRGNVNFNPELIAEEFVEWCAETDIDEVNVFIGGFFK